MLLLFLIWITHWGTHPHGPSTPRKSSAPGQPRSWKLPQPALLTQSVLLQHLQGLEPRSWCTLQWEPALGAESHQGTRRSWALWQTQGWPGHRGAAGPLQVSPLFTPCRTGQAFRAPSPDTTQHLPSPALPCPPPSPPGTRPSLSLEGTPMGSP